jgi:hypothetical protein
MRKKYQYCGWRWATMGSQKRSTTGVVETQKSAMARSLLSPCWTARRRASCLALLRAITQASVSGKSTWGSVALSLQKKSHRIC